MERTGRRTKSEFIREALRHYERRSQLDDINGYGRSKADRRGMHKQDVDRLGHELRATKRAVRSDSH